MIDIIDGLPANVIGISVRGKITRQDCTDVLAPALDQALEWHYRLRLYYVVRSRFPGATWEPVAFAAGRKLEWERVAIVSDVAWLTHTVQALQLVIPSEIRTFTSGQTPKALGWITEAPRRDVLIAAGLIDGARAQGKSFEPRQQFLYEDAASRRWV